MQKYKITKRCEGGRNCLTKRVKKTFLLVPVKPVCTFLTSILPLLFSIEYYRIQKKQTVLGPISSHHQPLPKSHRFNFRNLKNNVDFYRRFSRRGKQGLHKALSCAKTNMSSASSVQPRKSPQWLLRNHSASISTPSSCSLHTALSLFFVRHDLAHDPVRQLSPSAKWSLVLDSNSSLSRITAP